MKVLDNLENYEIPRQFRLSEDKEIRFAKDVADIVKALIPIRESKLKNRQFFNARLRFSSNKKEDEELPFGPDEKYVAKPGEYEWDSDLLHHALLSILCLDEKCFGFIINLIREDDAYRKGERLQKGSKISDALVAFSNKFDFDEIRKKAKAIKSIPERIIYLNEKCTECLNFAGLSFDEATWFGDDIRHSLESLRDEAEKEFSILQQAKMIELQKISIREDITPAKKLSSTILYYDLSVSLKDEYKPLGISIPDRWEVDESRNTDAFSILINSLFSSCFNDDEDMLQNEAAFNLTPHMIVDLADSYVNSIKQLEKNNDRILLEKFTGWVLFTHSIIEKAFENNPRQYFGPSKYGVFNDYDSKSTSTLPFYTHLLETLYWYYSNYFGCHIPNCPESAKNLVPYNFWIGEFESLQQRYKNQFGLELENKAVVFEKENNLFFNKQTRIIAIQFGKKQVAKDPYSFPSEARRASREVMSQRINSLFRDYLSRVTKVTTVKKEIDDAVLNWHSNTVKNIYNYCETEKDSIAHDCATNGTAYYSVKLFYYDVCAWTITEMVAGYFSDWERIDITSVITQSSSDQCVPNQAQEQIQTVTEVECTPKAHSCKIDYEGLFEEWKDIAFKNISLEEFKYAIDKPDFDNMMQKAKDIGNKSGYMGGTLFMIRYLSTSLKKKWYQDACATIGKTTNEVDKVHGDTKKAKQIAAVTLDQYIK